MHRDQQVHCMHAHRIYICIYILTVLGRLWLHDTLREDLHRLLKEIRPVAQNDCDAQCQQNLAGMGNRMCPESTAVLPGKDAASSQIAAHHPRWSAKKRTLRNAFSERGYVKTAPLQQLYYRLPVQEHVLLEMCTLQMNAFMTRDACMTARLCPADLQTGSL